MSHKVSSPSNNPTPLACLEAAYEIGGQDLMKKIRQLPVRRWHSAVREHLFGGPADPGRTVQVDARGVVVTVA